MAVTFNDYIYNCYNSRYGGSTQFRDRGYNYKTLEECSPFHKYIKVDLNKDIIEIPCVYKYMVTSILNEFNTTVTIDKSDYLSLFNELCEVMINKYGYDQGSEQIIEFIYSFDKSYITRDNNLRNRVADYDFVYFVKKHAENNNLSIEGLINKTISL